MNKVLIICFHGLASKKSGVRNLEELYTHEVRKFVTFLEIIRNNNIPVISLYDLISNSAKAKYSIALTFDDGNKSDYLIAFPLLKSFGFPASFFPIVDNIDKQAVSRLMITEMAAHPLITFGSHGLTHRRLTQLSEPLIKRELERSKYLIENYTCKPVDFFSLPYGTGNSSVTTLAAETGYKAVLTTRVKLNFPQRQPFELYRWAPKATTGLNTFEKMITCNPLVLQPRIWSSSGMFFAKKLLGSSITDRINLAFH